MHVVGRCRLIVSKPVLKAPLVPQRFQRLKLKHDKLLSMWTPLGSMIVIQNKKVMNCFSKLACNCKVRHYSGVLPARPGKTRLLFRLSADFIPAPQMARQIGAEVW